ncbi:MAG: ABC transporter ATP-binding protein [Nitrososphaerota archaeon]|nr:ABC transporter ATP-binding protein [Nitrososphaerales archaeon]MDW8044975.1 ABC transporter ATP-binding protein [Nitrososphaerota archaeon]
MRKVLEVRDLQSGYGEMQVLWGVNIDVFEKSLEVIIGPNGAGKTTLLRTLMGIIKPWDGKIFLEGRDITNLRSNKRVEMGITLVPEGRALFPEMTVIENLMMGAYRKEARENMKDSIEFVFNLFPILKERSKQIASTLSGGEQQMLAIGRALMNRPKILLLDEPSQGLAPKIAREVISTLNKLKDEGLSILLVEQNIHLAFEFSDYLYLLEMGKIVQEGKGREVLSDGIIRAYLGL